MASISVTYSFSNGTTADASQVNQNFTDIINGTSDGTKDFSISGLTVAGTANLNGNINLGNASADQITFTGSLSSSLPVKTTNSYDVGSSTLGLRTIYLGGGAGSNTTALAASSSLATTWTFTFPTGGGSSGQYLKTNGSGTTSWATPSASEGGTGLTSYTTGDLLYFASGTTLSKLAIGTARQVLQTNSGATAPEWSSTISVTGITLTGNLTLSGSDRSIVRADDTGRVFIAGGSTTSVANGGVVSIYGNSYGSSLGGAVVINAGNGAATNPIQIANNGTNILVSDSSNIWTLGTAGSGVKFANSTASYSPAALNYYEEDTASAGFSGCFSQTVTVRIVRVGKSVSIYLPAVTGTSTSATTLSCAADTIKARFRPYGQVVLPVKCTDNGTSVVGLVVFQTDGSIIIQRDVSGGNFAATGTVGLNNGVSTAWYVA